MALLISVAPAQADTGQLTPQGCFEDTGAPPTGCGAAENQGLAGAHAIAASPDGKSVYATGLTDDAVSIFSRDPATGVLTPQGCVSDEDAFPAQGCADFQEGMAEPFGIAVSPDGLSVYVTARNDDSVANLDRDPATGDLDGAGCIGNTGDIATCGVATQTGLADPAGVVVSPDGQSVYVSARHAVVRLVRASTGGNVGAISPGTCVGDTPDPGVGCPTLQEGLNDAYALAISPDGASLHVAARGDGAVVSLTTPSFGSLGCISDVDNPPLAGCAQTVGVHGGRGIAVSPDGKSVYSVGGGSALVRFDRSATGTLTPAGCISDPEVSIGCTASQQGLGLGHGVAVSPDNRSVYAVGDDDAIVRFDRDPSAGALTARGCIADAPDPIGCGASAPALNTAREVVVSPDGKSVYMTSFGDAAVTRFDRESAAVTPPPNPPSNAITVRTKKVTCKGACKKVKVKLDVDGPGGVRFCNAPAGSPAPCGIGGTGPTAPRHDPGARLGRASTTKAIKAKSLDVSAAGTVETGLKLTKKARATLSKKGKLRFTLQVDFTPTGGTTNSERQDLKVKRKD